MTRTPLSSLAIAAILAMATGSLLQNTEAYAGEKKGKGTNAGLLGWATFPSYGNQPRTRLRSTAGEPARKGNNSRWLRVGQPATGGSSQFDAQIDSMMNNNIILSKRSKNSKNLKATRSGK
jgi:hypothetical protein